MIVDFIRTYRKNILIIVGIIVAILIFVIMGNVVNMGKNIIISKVPNDTKLTINGERVNGDRTALANGTYKIHAEKEGFYPYDEDVVIDDDSKTVAVTLLPDSEDAQKWFDANQQQYLDQEAAMGDIYGQEGQSVVDANPIIADLPLKSENYLWEIGYKQNPNDKTGRSIIVTIQAPEGFRNAAIQDIIDHGYNPGDYQIEFSDFVNPFKEGKANGE